MFKNRTRLKITLIFLFVLLSLTIASMCVEMESLAITCVGGIIATVSTYIFGETKRESKY